MLLPLIAFIALAIKLDSRGPVIFRQIRVGRGGQEFGVFKFRTMVVNADALLAELAARNETDGLMFKMRHDPRVTRVGRLLRKWSLDELPQLVNVLLGQMSLVGPRPPLPSEVARYDGDVARRLLVKPGMTGLWQVSGRSDLSWEDGIRLDLYYVENWSLAADLTILWKTFGAVLNGRRRVLTSPVTVAGRSSPGRRPPRRRPGHRRRTRADHRSATGPRPGAPSARSAAGTGPVPSRRTARAGRWPPPPRR